ncbi:HD domain-containing protein [Myxococcota bacterium]|nr:HD domain-containing protein [Myxococcota bacterium]MBU1429879.1 HD domain-containing protein [Myxococcota bacterium]MBU1897907.1 HD domain-containing protein [Myxococcota bacterium]
MYDPQAPTDTPLHWRRLPPLPPLPPSTRAAIVGAAARRLIDGRRLHRAPELWVEGPVEGPPAPGLRGAVAWGAWRVYEVTSLEAALEARALPIDALGITTHGARLDPLGGLEAWRQGHLSVPADVEAAPHRLLRVLALASELRLTLDEPTLAALSARPWDLLKATPEALREALTDLLVGAAPAMALEAAQRCGLLTFVLPEVSALDGFHKTSRHHHKDLFWHTLKVVEQCVPRPEIRWAALLHDVAKVHTRSFGPGKAVHFLRHEPLGALIFKGIAARLDFEPAQAQRIHDLIFHHLRAQIYAPEWTDAAVRRFDAELGGLLPDLLALSRADVTSRRPGRRRAVIRGLHALKARLEAVRAQDAANKAQIPKGLGAQIITALGVAPGPEVGRLRQLCDEAVKAGVLVEPSIDDCVAFLRRRLDE